MLTIQEARERVSRGAAHLDRVRPGWHERIDVGTLTLHDPCGCIVGQLCGTGGQFRVGLKQLAMRSVAEARALGFDLNEPGYQDFLECGGTRQQWYQPLQDAWIEAIAARLHPATNRRPTAFCA